MQAYEALAGEGSLPNQTIGVGTVKANVGHLEAAAGVAGVIKVLLALKHQQLPGLAGFDKINPHIDIKAGI